IKEDLKDRFGTLPAPTITLFNVVLIRRIAVELGFEKVIIKNGYFIVHFVYNQTSAYYRGSIFKAIMEYIGQQGDNFKFKPKDGRVLLSVSHITSTEKALALMENMREFVMNKVK
ncbi:MAG: TRCF domain-containing protein, partial [Rikenellaceae bacterium]